jgi:hypothetical protein
MNLEHMPAGYKLSLRGWQLALFLMPFLVMLNARSALGQGYKMTKLNIFNSTSQQFPLAVNKSEAVVGDYGNGSGGTSGFLYAGGKYTSLDYPGAANFTRGNGINDSGTVAGDFYDGQRFFHGYTYANGTYTQYDVDKGVTSTSIFGINNAGDFAGAEGVNGVDEGFTTISGTVTEFYASGTDNTFAYAINSADDVVGQYFDSSGNSHGFYQCLRKHHRGCIPGRDPNWLLWDQRLRRNYRLLRGQLWKHAWLHRH